VAAAAALVVWVAVPQQRAASVPADRLHARVDRGPARSVPAPEASPKAETAPSAVEPEAKAADRTAPAAPALEKQEADAPPAPALERRERFADAAASAPAPPAASPAQAAPPPPPAAPEQLKSLQETVTVTGESPARADERQNAASTRQQRVRGAVGGTAALRTSSALVIIAADGAARWQRSGGALEFAPRGDVPFTAATLPVAADAIAAGSAPGGTVCWFVGRGGLVLVSTDGVRFERGSAPAPVDLVGITAIDARGAIVTAAGGRRFKTADRGATWSALP